MCKKPKTGMLVIGQIIIDVFEGELPLLLHLNAVIAVCTIVCLHQPRLWGRVYTLCVGALENLLAGVAWHL